MPIPFIGWAAIIVISIATGYSVYQLRLSVKDVTEVFTAQDSVFNSGIMQISIASIALYALIRFTKG